MTTRSRRRLALALLALVSALAAGAIHERDLARRMSSAVVAFFHGAAQPRQFALAADAGGGAGGAFGSGSDDRDASTRQATLAQIQAATHAQQHGHDNGGAAPDSEADLFTLGAPAAGPHQESVQGGSGVGSGSGAGGGGDGGASSGPAGTSSGDAGPAPVPGSFGAGIAADNLGGGSSKATASDTASGDGSASVSSVPEPDNLALMAAGALALLGAALKRKSR